MAMTDNAYPFAGIVGMADLKLALLLNAVSPAIGGVLVRGEKGTAKSTMVRGLAALLPPVPVVPGCPYSCDPAAPDLACPAGPHGVEAAELRPVTLAELPVGATEDRLTGSLDIERVLTAGTTAFQPGLLAAAHRGVLYVDEVNLLHDHLVDLLLDAAALGVNYVEREGVSVRHASRFLLVGTMNPEEGELRPQLLDRFGLTVQVTASTDPAERAEVVRRRLAFEADPAAFGRRFAADTAALAGQVAAARARLPRVELPDAALRQICAVCGAFGVDGMRADLVTARTAIALAAWGGRDVVTEEDVRIAARLALPHRRRRDPFDAPGLDEQALDDALREAANQGSDAPGDPEDDPDGPDPNGPGPGPDGPGPDGPGPGGPEDPEDHGPDGPEDPEDRGPEDPDDPGPSGPRGQPDSQANPSSQPSSQVTETPSSPTGITGGPVPRPAADRARRRRGRPRPPLRRPRPVRPHRGRPRPAGPPLRPAPPCHRPRRRGPRAACHSARPSTRLPGPPHHDRGSSGQIAPKTARDHGIAQPAPARRVRLDPPTCARRCGRAGRGTSCFSPWTPAGQWRPGSGCARSRARCCLFCWMPTSVATRWGWSRSAAPEPSSPFRPPPRSRPPPAA